MSDTTEQEHEAPVGPRPANLPSSIRDRHALVPSHYMEPSGRIPDEALVYLVRVPSEHDFALLRREIRRKGAMPVAEDALYAARLAAVDVLPAEERPAMREAIERLRDLDHDVARGRNLEAARAERIEVGRMVGAFETQASRQYLPLAELIADASFYDDVTRTAAAALWLDGVTTASDESYSQVRKFERDGLGRVTDDELVTIPYLDKYEVGIQALMLRRTTPAQKKS
jgi:hypothetical protein